MTTGERPQCNPGQEAPIVGAAEASISPFHAFIAAEAAPTIQYQCREKFAGNLSHFVLRLRKRQVVGVYVAKR
ncbi:MAG: hypothetical protein WAL83_05425, partial [Arenicellales bacterium]